MSDQFVAEIRIFAGNFAPRGWAFCQGQLLPISQNTALFSLIGTFYGGDGRTTFALPDLQGNSPLGQGSGPGLTTRFVGEIGGSATVTLIATELPQHVHAVNASSAGGLLPAPPGNLWATPGAARGLKAYEATGGAAMAPAAISNSGSSQPHNNRIPYLCLSFIIALQGIFPARS